MLLCLPGNTEGTACREQGCVGSSVAVSCGGVSEMPSRGFGWLGAGLALHGLQPWAAVGLSALDHLLWVTSRHVFQGWRETWLRRACRRGRRRGGRRRRVIPPLLLPSSTGSRATCPQPRARAPGESWSSRLCLEQAWVPRFPRPLWPLEGSPRCASWPGQHLCLGEGPEALGFEG